MLTSFRYISKLIKSSNRLALCQCKNEALLLYRNKTNSSGNPKESPKNTEVLGSMSSKYQIYQDKDAEVILDVYEERLKYLNLEDDTEEVEEDRCAGLNLERGLTGVFEIEDLVEVLKLEKAKDIFVASVPKEMNYIDYICIVSGKSSRHLRAIAQFVKRVYKHKRAKGDLIPKIEGENSKDWMALDLGNIALHMFSDEARMRYDLETLWTVGPEYDDEFNKPEPVSEMLEKHSIYLKGLEPAT